MSRQSPRFLKTTALAAAVLFFAAGPAAAQRGGGGHGGGGGGPHGPGGGGGGGSRGGWGNYGGSGYHGGYGYGRYYGHGGYYPGWYGFGIGIGYSPYFDGGSYSSAGYYGIPSLGDYASLETPVPYSRFYPPRPADPGPNAPGGAATPADDKAHVRVVVPAGAEVWFDGERTSQSGSLREFVSPPLAPDDMYAYEVRARWMENGKPVEQTRRVLVRAGALTTVDFTRPAPAR
jgi:uncharacterized protein (TIGR03000 family)